MPSIIPATGSYTVEDRDRWMPKVKAGYFFIGDRKYHLYALKKCIRVEQCKKLRLHMAVLPSTITSLKIDSVSYTNYIIDGLDVVVDLEDIDQHINTWYSSVWGERRKGYYADGVILTEDAEIEIEYTGMVWDSTTHSFTSVSVTQYFYVRDGEEYYSLPDTPIAGSPVIITDDSKLDSDAREYSIEFDSDYEGNLTFNAAKNYALNPNFGAASGSHPEVPLDWELFDATGNMHRFAGTGYVGLWTLYMNGVTGKARSVVPISTIGPLALSVRARMATTGHSGTGYLEIAYRDVDNQILDGDGNVIGIVPDPTPYAVRAIGDLDDRTWTEISLVVGDNTDVEPTDDTVPSGVEAVEIRLFGSGSGPIEFDAVQLQKSALVTQYGYISPGASVEYELNGTGSWTPDPSSLSDPFTELNHVDLNAANEEGHSGFLIMEEFSDTYDSDLPVGGSDTDNPQVTYRGIVPKTGGFWRFGRKNLPYARVDGKNKLVHRYPQRLENQGYNDPVNPYQDPRDPAFGFIIPPDNTRRDASGYLHIGIKALTEDVVSCAMMDQYGNPIIHELVSIVTTTGSLSATGRYTNDAGRVKIGYTAPAAGTGTLDFTHVLSGKTWRTYVDTV